jgi:hypothetical protein
MALSGSCDVTPGVQQTSGKKWTTALFNLLGRPTVRVGEGTIGDRELIGDSVRGFVPSVVRNILINGNFDIWQRGGFTNLSGLPTVLGAGADLEFGPDRWSLGDPAAGAASRQVYRGSFDLGQTLVPNEPTYYLRWDQTSAETNPTLTQPIEDVRTLAGKKATLTWWMRSNTSGTVTVQLQQFFGGAGPTQSRVIAATSGGSAVLTGGAPWVKFEAHFDVPSLLGYAIGGNLNCLNLMFILPSAVTFLTDFAQVQLEQSSVATAFEVHSAQYELERCWRYFEYHGGIGASSLATSKPCFYYCTRKYRTPDIAIFGAISGTGLAFAPITDIGYYQSVANSVITAFFVTVDAEIHA